ncbi:hypothetical protein RQP46_010973 [Phenoliferia psychrophenolica]
MSREAPMETPPPYAAVRYVKLRSSLRPTVLLTCAFGTTASSVKTMDIVMAALWLFAGAVELYGFGACWTQRITLVRYYFYAAGCAAIAVTVAALMRLIVHFTSKSDIIASCATEQFASNDGFNDITMAQAQSVCSSAWNNGTWWDIALLIISGLVAFFFASLAASYLHQLLNPSTLRQQTANLAPSSQYAYPLAPYQGPPGGFVPPYSGPQFAPPPGAPPGYGGPPPQWEGEDGYGKEKEEHNPFADATTPTTAGGYGGHSTGAGGGFNRREQESESTDTVTLEPRRENEGRV